MLASRHFWRRQPGHQFLRVLSITQSPFPASLFKFKEIQKVALVLVSWRYPWIALQHACLCSYIKIERVCTHQRKCKKCYVGWTFWKNMNNHRSKRRHNVSRMICLRIPCKKRGQEAFVLCMARIMRMTFKY